VTAVVRWLVVVLLLLLGLLQHRLWFGDGGLSELWALRDQIRAQEAELARLRDRNSALAAEVHNLKTGLDAIEERARNELGMIRSGELFLQVVEPEEAGEAGEAGEHEEPR
jgi:cell division protein FtsB